MPIESCHSLQLYHLIYLAHSRVSWWQGRLIDHLRNTQMVGLEDLQTLVLDEADRLLEMGFADEVLHCGTSESPFGSHVTDMLRKNPALMCCE